MIDDLRWEVDKSPKKIDLGARLRSVGCTLSVCVGLLGVVAFMQNRDLAVKVEVQQGMAARLVAVQRSCAADKFYRTSYICQKALASNP